MYQQDDDNNSSVDSIAAVYKAYPEAASKQDANGQFPHQLAVKNGFTLWAPPESESSEAW